ncbi:methyltransferase domain-containing protein [Chelativorans xinjiangense]|uniref:methyltransferase domain-containing protein n=1 Tax=Chelativorans xinjiangense TaxID=2681485 RepID=UPI00135BF2E7|nr:methyltransferase domain-containing protein [Chelativorans xinjiangense]
MHGLRHVHGPSAGSRLGHFRIILVAKLAFVIALLALVPYWTGLLSWAVALHAVLVALLLGLGAVALFRHGMATQGSAHDDAHGNAGITIHGAAFYDLVASVMTLGRERRLREAMLGVVRLRPGEAMLDVACGTGTLAIAAAGEVGASGEVVGVDASKEMLERATVRARRAGVVVQFRQGTAQSLSFPDAHFNVVTGTLMLHHISPEARAAFAREARRVLKPGGRLVLIDFGVASGAAKLFGFHSHGGVDPDHAAARLQEIGFADVRVSELGMMGLYAIEAKT